MSEPEELSWWERFLNFFRGEEGETGATGATGAQGAVGVQGDVGPAGPQGDAGPAGPIGPKGDIGLTGPIGPKGDTGLTGPVGPKGDTGLTGPIGPKGDTGLTGPIGPMGPKGDVGPPGPPLDQAGIDNLRLLQYNADGSATFMDLQGNVIIGNAQHDKPEAASTLSVFGASPAPADRGKPSIYHRSNVGLGLSSDNDISFEVAGNSGESREAARFKRDGSSEFKGHVKVLSSNTINFGTGTQKQADAGRIGYNTFSTDSLDIIGAGTLPVNRKVKMWDQLHVTDKIDAQNELCINRVLKQQNH